MSGKKALMLASVASMIDQFNIPNIRLLQSLGYKVDTAADFTSPGTITAERAEELKRRLDEMEVGIFDVAIPRTLSPRAIRAAYKKVRMILAEGQYDLIHCHSPIGGAICRLAARDARKRGTRVIYTAHGFHFYSGAPLKNWLLFYPVEKYLSRYTDVLITINREDYARAKERFHAKQTVYVPGIGVDIERFALKKTICHKRLELGIPEDVVLFISIGELSHRKNHKAIIDALASINDDYFYIIVGKGDLEGEIIEAINRNGLSSKIKLLGYRTDIDELLWISDCFLFPSFQEGLPVALMEAMAAGLPVACSRIRGNTDLIDEGKGGFFFDPSNSEEAAESIRKLLIEDRIELGNYNKKKITSFSIQRVKDMMKRIYGSI